MFAHFLNWYRRLPKTRKRHSNWDKLTQTCYSTWKVTVVERMDNPSRTHVSWHGTTALHWGCLSNDPEACKATFAKACPRKQHDINTWSWLQDVLYVSPSSPQRFSLSLSLSLGRISTRKRGYAKNRLCLCNTHSLVLKSIQLWNIPLILDGKSSNGEYLVVGLPFLHEHLCSQDILRQFMEERDVPGNEYRNVHENTTNSSTRIAGCVCQNGKQLRQNKSNRSQEKHSESKLGVYLFRLRVIYFLDSRTP